jgi:hypothetical protein
MNYHHTIHAGNFADVSVKFFGPALCCASARSRRFHPDKGYGFIKPDGDERDGLQSLDEGRGRSAFGMELFPAAEQGFANDEAPIKTFLAMIPFNPNRITGWGCK